MAVTFVAVSTTGTLVAGVTTTAGTAACSPGLPVGTASGDRVYLLQSASNTSAAAPANWNQLYKDVQVGVTGTVPGAGTGRRYISAYYRDYDGVWTMPSMALTSATQNSNSAYGLTLRKDAAEAWDTPTFSSPGHDTTNATSWSITTPSFATIAAAMLMSHTAHTGGAATASAQTMTQTGATFANLTERIDNGTATGNDVRIVVGTTDVTVGATAAVTRTATLSAAATGGTALIQQTVSAIVGPVYAGKGTTVLVASAANLALAHPANLAANDIEIAHVYLETPNVSITPPTGWLEIGTEASSGGTNTAIYRWFWKRAAGGETGSVTFTHGAVWRGGYITRWTNCVTSGNPFEDPGPSASSGTTGNTVTPAVSDTTDGPDRLLLFAAANWTGAHTWTPPTGFTEQYDSGDEVGGFSTKPQAVAGSTGSITATSSVSGPLVARLLILVPPSGTPAEDLTKFFLSAA